MTQDKPTPVENYELGRWLKTRTTDSDAFLVQHNTLWGVGGKYEWGVMVGVKDLTDAAVTTLTVEQARGLATLLLYQAKLSEERNSA